MSDLITLLVCKVLGLVGLVELEARAGNRDRSGDSVRVTADGGLADPGPGFFAGRWVARLTDGLFGRLGLDRTLRQLLNRVVRILVVCPIAIMALQNPGIDLLPLLAGLGLAGAGLALALHGILGNLAAGLTIIFTRPFLVGEYISIAKEEGVVVEILHNFGMARQIDVQVGVADDTEIERAVQLALAADKESQGAD